MCHNTSNRVQCAIAPVPGSCYIMTADIADLQSDWRMENVEQKPKDSAQVHQTLFLASGDETMKILA